MKYKISYTDANKSKKATFGFKPYETDDIAAFVRVLNNFATCPVLLSEGHRANKNVKEVYGWLRFDTDEEGEARQVETAFTDAFYIKKPSTRNKQYPYKWHFFIKVDNQAQNTQQFKSQCLQICEARGIILKDMAVTKIAVQNMNAYEGTIEDAVAATTVHEGDTIHLPAPTQQEQEPVHETIKPEGFSNLDDETDTGTTVAYDRSVGDIEKMLEGIDAGCDRETWMGLVTSAYKLNPTSRDTVLAWSETGSNFTQQGFDNLWNEIEAGTYGAHHKGGFLIQTYNESKGEEALDKFDKYANLIHEAESLEAIKKIFKSKDWKAEPLCTAAQQKELPQMCSSRATELHKLDSKSRKAGVGEFKPLVLIEEKIEAASPEGLNAIKSYTFDNKFAIVYKDKKLIEDRISSQLDALGTSLKISGTVLADRVKYKSEIIQGIKKETDYKIEKEVSYKLRKSLSPSEFPFLHVLTNPLHKIQEPAKRQDIVEDFFSKIWRNKVK